jgi:hypothetical protein
MKFDGFTLRLAYLEPDASHSIHESKQETLASCLSTKN